METMNTESTGRACKTNTEAFFPKLQSSAYPKKSKEVAELIVDNDSQIILKDGIIVAGTITGLVSALFKENTDVDYVQNFLLSFRTIMTPRELLSSIFENYPMQRAPMSEKEFSNFSLATFELQTRILTVILMWLKLQIQDFEKYKLVKTLVSFIEEASLQCSHPELTMVIRSLLQEKSSVAPFKLDIAETEIIIASLKRADCSIPTQIRKTSKGWFRCFTGCDLLIWLDNNFGTSNREEMINLIKSLLIKKKILQVGFYISSRFKGSKYYRIADQDPMNVDKTVECPDSFGLMNPKAIAQQLTAFGEEIFGKVALDDFRSLKNLDKPSTSNDGISILIRRFNKIGDWTATVVLSSLSLERPIVIAKFIQVLVELEKLKNFNDLGAIVSDLSRTPISRLNSSWEAIPKKLSVLFKHFEDTYSGTSPALLLRALSTASSPAIPHVMFNISSLFKLNETTPDYMREGIVDFSKNLVIAKLLSQMEKFRTKSHCFRKLETFQFYIQTAYVVDQTMQEEISFSIQPPRRKPILKVNM